MTKAQWSFGAQKRILDLGYPEQSWETSNNPVGHTGPLGRDRVGRAKDDLSLLLILFLGQCEDEGHRILIPYLLYFPLQDQVGAGLQRSEPASTPLSP